MFRLLLHQHTHTNCFAIVRDHKTGILVNDVYGWSPKELLVLLLLLPIKP